MVTLIGNNGDTAGKREQAVGATGAIKFFSDHNNT